MHNADKEILVNNADKLAMELVCIVLKLEELPAKRKQKELLQKLREYLVYSENYGYQQAMLGSNMVDGMW
jgi:type VI protein secretion system component VasF|tara:strand:+ start:535 stop:744 length:210 start_codon:yes stop_codon:yes gene_type:complete